MTNLVIAKINIAGSEDKNGGEENNIINIVIVVIAMQAEALPLVEALVLMEDDESSTIFPKETPFKKYSGEIDGLNVHVIVPRVDNVGIVPSSLLTYASGVALRPHLIINVGIAGGFQAKGANIGDVYVATEFVNHDRMIPIHVFDRYEVGTIESILAGKLIKDLNLKEGKLSTGNSLDMSKQDKEYIKANDATVKDMEGAAVAYVASLLAIPLILLKAVTDIVDGNKPTVEEFLENLSMASSALSRTLPLVLKYVTGKCIADLDSS